MTLKEKRAAAVKAAQEIIDGAKAEEREELNDQELADVKAYRDEVASLDEQIERAAKSAALVAEMSKMPVGDPDDGVDDSGEGDAPAAKAGSVGDRFVKSEAFQRFRKDHPSGIGSGTPVRIEARGIGDAADLGIGRKATITTGTGQIGPEREPGYYNALPVDEPLTFLDLVTTGSTDVAYSEYAQVVSETDNAAIVAEGDLKPTSDITTDVQESKAYTYADGFDITNQTLADDGALAAFMESRIRRHVRGVVEGKLFNGSGSGTEPTGIMKTNGTLSQAFSEDAVVTLARSLETFEDANGNTSPQAIVMNPSDVWNLRLLKDKNGDYLLGNPLQQGPIPTPWGVPLVASNKLAKGKALVGRFDSVNFLTLDPLNVLAFNQHKDYAQRNMVYVRAELRGRQLFYVPREVVVATIAGSSGGSSQK